MHKNEEESLIDTLDRLPMKDIIKEGDKVVITPNWLKTMSPQYWYYVVGPRTLRTLIEYIKRYNPQSITIAMVPIQNQPLLLRSVVGYRSCYKRRR